MCSFLRERETPQCVLFINVFPEKSPPPSLSERIVKERRCARHVSRCRRAPDAREDDEDEEDEEEESLCFEEPSSFRNTQTEGGFFFVWKRTQKKYARL